LPSINQKYLIFILQ